MSEKNSAAKASGKKLRLNIIDFLIIVVILGAVAGIALRFGVVEKVVTKSSLSSAYVSFLIQDIQDESANYFVAGDSFYSQTHSAEFGVLQSNIQFLPAEAYINNEVGELLKVYKEDRIDVRGVFLCEGIFTDEGFLLNGTSYIAPGSTVHVLSSTIDVTLTVTEIDAVGAES
ncbi:MAG: DUF4330 family protein [Clostridia bacterium]|nr:DUF4330 family protein [Clostridia bacterium]